MVSEIKKYIQSSYLSNLNIQQDYKVYRVKDLPKDQRPREKLIQKGPQNLKDEELLVILLETSKQGKKKRLI